MAMEESKLFFGLSENFSVPLPVVISTGETWADLLPWIHQWVINHSHIPWY